MHAYDEGEMLQELLLRQHAELAGIGSASATLAAQQRFRATLLQTTQGLDYLHPDISDQFPLQEDAIHLLGRRGAM